NLPAGPDDAELDLLVFGKNCRLLVALDPLNIVRVNLPEEVVGGQGGVGVESPNGPVSGVGRDDTGGDVPHKTPQPTGPQRPAPLLLAALQRLLGLLSVGDILEVNGDTAVGSGKSPIAKPPLHPWVVMLEFHENAFPAGGLKRLARGGVDRFREDFP